MPRVVGTALALSLLFLFSASFARANSVDLLSFEGMKDQQSIVNFYNGGGPGTHTPNFGITFSPNFIGLLPSSLGGSGNYTPFFNTNPAIFINGTGSVIGSMTDSHGFTTGINFFYTAAFQETVTVWSGPGGTGTVLATMALSSNDNNCSGGSGCNWTDVGISFKGTAGSVTFSGPAGGFGMVDITLGQQSTLLPEPSSIYLLGTGLLALGASQIRRFLGL